MMDFEAKQKESKKKYGWKALTINQKEQGETKQVKFFKLSHPFVRQAIRPLNPQIKD